MIAGFDLSSKKIAAWWLEGKKYNYTTFKFNHKDHGARAYMAQESMNEWLGECGQWISAVYIESLFVHRLNTSGVLPQAYVHGVVMSSLWGHGGIYVEHVPNKTWKLATVGSGAASKDDIKAYVSATIPGASVEVINDQDLCDAFGVFRYGLQANLSRRR
jgi:Holliday junction resolvasome RuvABC endonuclease subunit